MPIPSSPRPPAAKFTSSTTPLPSAGVLRRLAALIYDAFLLFGLLVVPLFIWTAITNGQGMPQDAVAHDLPSVAPRPMLLAYMIVVIVGFYGYFWRKSGQTLGMQAWRLRVDDEHGGRIGWPQCCLRAAIGLLSLLCAGCGYWWIWLDKNRMSWHDRASHSRVVVLPKKQ